MNSDLALSKKRAYTLGCLSLLSMALLLFCIIYLKMNHLHLVLLTAGWLILTYIIMNTLVADMAKLMAAYLLRKQGGTTSQPLQDDIFSAENDNNDNQSSNNRDDQ